MNVLLDEYSKQRNYYMKINDIYKKENENLLMVIEDLKNDKIKILFENLCLKVVLCSSATLIGYLYYFYRK